MFQVKVLHWTNHARAKMRFYGLSEARLRRILHSPKRVEEGIAPKTTAFMQSAGSKSRPYELWAMVQDVGKEREIISAWRYPGVTKPKSASVTEGIRVAYNEYMRANA